MQWKRKDSSPAYVGSTSITRLDSYGPSATLRLSFDLRSNQVPALREIRRLLFGLDRAILVSEPRGVNKAADALCNWAMDIAGGSAQTPSGGFTSWPMPPILAQHPILLGARVSPIPSSSEFAYRRWRACWGVVMTDYNRIAHLVTHRFLEPANGGLASRRESSQPRASAVVDTTARWDPSPASPDTVPSTGYPAVFRWAYFEHFKHWRRLMTFPFRWTLRFSSRPGTIPPSLSSMSPYCPRSFSCRTSTSTRLCAFSEARPLGTTSSLRVGVRPLPSNYPSAIEGARVVTNRLLHDYYKGRSILATVTALSSDPSFHSSAFALVPKQDKPISEDGRIIHDLSAPAGLSFNDTTDVSFPPDARWDPYVSISSRVLELRRRYPGYAVYALGVDIAEAFLHIPVHSRHASAFGGTIPRSQVGIVSGIAVFGWTASPGYFAVASKAARHCQRTGASYVLGFPEPFWIFQWVDDIVIIEVDIGERLLHAERRLRDAINLVFGSEGWHEGTFRTWSQCFHAVVIDWNIPESNITIPQRKIAKTKRVVEETLTMSFITQQRLDSLVGVLRHIVTFIPIAKPFMQRLIAVQLATKTSGRTGTPMTESLQLDLEWWDQLIFQNEFAVVPMTLFDRELPEVDGWVITHTDHEICIHGLKPSRSERYEYETPVGPTQIADAVYQTIIKWISVNSMRDKWSHIQLYVQNEREAKLFRSMYCQTPEG